jgi:hypothetical protein
MKKSSEQVFTLSEDVLFQEVGGEMVLLDMASENYFGLDSIGARIWQMLGEGLNLAEVVASLFEEYEIDAETLETDVCEFIDSLQEAGLIKNP